MSTNLRNGYYLKLCTLQQLHKFSLTLRKRMLETQKKLYAKKLINLAVETYDTRTLTKAGYYELDDNDTEHLSYPALRAAYWIINDRYQKTQGSMVRDVDYDLTCNVVVIPTKTKILAMIFAEQPEFHYTFAETKGVHPYGYQNSTDALPEKITRKEYEAIGKEWDRAMPTGIPSMSGFDIPCTGKFLPNTETDELLQLYPIPTFEKRVKEHTTEILSRKFFKRTIKTDKVPLTEVVPRVSEWVEFKESDNGKAEYELLKPEIESHLKNPLTKEDLEAEPGE